jgi:hypothetical protein
MGIKTVRTILDKTTTPPMKRKLLVAWYRMLDVNIRYRKMIGRLGSLPNFIIIGTQKGGTTYLYDELIKHPYVIPALTKEVHFFDENYAKGIDWYRGFFSQDLRNTDNSQERDLITGEASPCYIFHPDAPRRVQRVAPEVKMIVLLRNPVNRALSHYHHEVRLGFETRSFKEAIAQEPELLRSEKEKMLADENYYSFHYMHHSYLTRGIYVDQLMAWMRIFPQDQMLILKSEDFYRSTPAVMQKITTFLGLPDWQPNQLGKPRVAHYPKMDENTRKHLAKYFEPHNQRLYDFLSVDFGWNT